MYLDWFVTIKAPEKNVQPIGDFVLVRIEPPREGPILTPFETIKYYKKPDLAQIVRTSPSICACLEGKWALLDEFATLVFLKDPDEHAPIYALVSHYDIAAVSDVKPNATIEKLEYRLYS